MCVCACNSKREKEKKKLDSVFAEQKVCLRVKVVVVRGGGLRVCFKAGMALGASDQATHMYITHMYIRHMYVRNTYVHNRYVRKTYVRKTYVCT